MYEETFGLHERPFAAVPNTAHYYPSAAMEGSRQTLSRCIERAEGAALLIGPAGTGKTLLCQVLAEQFRNQFEIALLDSGRLCTRRALLQAILFELGLPYRGMEEGELRLSLIDHLSPRDTFTTGLVLLVDEAHTLPLRLLEEIRMITNMVRGGQPRVRLLLAGGPLLEERFASPKLESFNQRLAARCYLHAMDREDTYGYVRHQISAVGGSPDKIFTPDALEAVYRATDGIPRLVNQVCDHALILADAGGASQLTKAGIEESWSDLQQLPTPWSAAPGAATEGSSSPIIEFGALDDDAVDEPHAVPFRKFPTGRNTSAFEPLAQLEQIQSDLAAIDDDFRPAGSIVPEVELVFSGAPDPFHEEFEEEEVVIDRYSSLEVDLLRHRPVVHSREGDELSQILSSCTINSQPALAIAGLTATTGDFSDHPTNRSSSLPERNQSLAIGGGPVISSTSVTFDGSERPADMHSDEQSDDAQNTAAQNAAHIAAKMIDCQVDEYNDDDLILLEDEAHDSVPRPTPIVRRQEYRQLFAKLRRG